MSICFSVVNLSFKKIFISLCQILVTAHGLRCPEAYGNLSSPTRDQTRIPCIARQILNHWSTKEMPLPFITEVSAKNSEG